LHGQDRRGSRGGIAFLPRTHLLYGYTGLSGYTVLDTCPAWLDIQAVWVYRLGICTALSVRTVLYGYTVRPASDPTPPLVGETFIAGRFPAISFGKLNIEATM
jgi:hypothetical protein